MNNAKEYFERTSSSSLPLVKSSSSSVHSRSYLKEANDNIPNTPSAIDFDDPTYQPPEAFEFFELPTELIKKIVKQDLTKWRACSELIRNFQQHLSTLEVIEDQISDSEFGEQDGDTGSDRQVLAVSQ